MSKYYGTLLGCRGEATRCGSSTSGIKASVQSWDGSLISEMQHNNDGELIIELSVSDSSTSCYGKRIFRGTLKELEEKLSK